jgi:hypothetical protein
MKKVRISKGNFSFICGSTVPLQFCHHLDFQWFGSQGSWHTRGLYERIAALYHHLRVAPPKQLLWAGSHKMAV